MHGRIEEISKEHGCSLSVASQLARHIHDIEADLLYARNYVNDHCIWRVPNGSKDLPAMGAPGKLGAGFYRWQFYLRSAFFNPLVMRIIVNDFFAKFGFLLRDNAVQLAGVESAAMPMLTAFSLEAARCGHPVNVFSVRKEAKAYGRRNWLEGTVTDKPVLLIDDLISSAHYTVMHAQDILAMHDIDMIGHMYCFMYKTHTPDDPVVRHGKSYDISHIFTLNDFDLLLEDYERARNQDRADAAA